MGGKYRGKQRDRVWKARGAVRETEREIDDREIEGHRETERGRQMTNRKVERGKESNTERQTDIKERKRKRAEIKL